ncbi:MAG: hypothetical protein KAT13_01265 [Methanosarcinales archaeon]|nr:hypothetical protein [Methanosarcinales archaeon]
MNRAPCLGCVFDFFTVIRFASGCEGSRLNPRPASVSAHVGDRQEHVAGECDVIWHDGVRLMR